MHFTGTTYRPPLEGMKHTKLLQVTTGCTHNQCTFCCMYHDVKFKISPLWQIEEDLAELRMKYEHIERIFLVNGDAFALCREKLEKITELIRLYIPEIEVISMYASIRNIKTKSEEDLEKIREMKIDEIWVGVETGNAETLREVRKGYTLEEAREQLRRLNQHHIRHNDGYILGLSGHGKGEESAKAAAKLINETHPNLVRFGTLSLFEGSQLYDAWKAGNFVAATEREILEEEMAVIRQIRTTGLPFYGLHATNATSVVGTLPQDRERLCEEIETYIRQTPVCELEKAVIRKYL